MLEPNKELFNEKIGLFALFIAKLGLFIKNSNKTRIFRSFLLIIAHFLVFFTYGNKYNFL